MGVSNYGTDFLKKNCTSKAAKAMFAKISAAEKQASELIKLFDQERYLAVELLLKKLQAQKVGKVDLVLVVALLSGYISGEGYESKLDLDAFGGHRSILDGKAETAQASLVGLVTMLNQKGVYRLPNRIPRQSKPKKAIIAKKVAKKK